MASAIVAILIVGLATVGGIGALPSANAVPSGSQLTIKWTGDNSVASPYQPHRDASSPHFPEFDDIAITVSQTTGIIDQAIRVSVTGFAGTKSSTQSGVVATNAKNYLQAMQCWGPDPLADDFNETCQWGGRYLVQNNGLGDSVISDNAARVGPLDVDTSHPTDHDVPFRTVNGLQLSGKPHLVNGVAKYDILDYFGPTSTNEVTSARVGSDGKGYFDFETQSSIQSTQMGCGTPQHLRCWLVVVPRGTVFGGNGEECSGIRDPANDYELYTKGRPNSIQGGSPVNDQCDYWANRIVVPLDFTPTGNTCPVGAAEVKVVGSQLMVGAMSSWQPSLCQTVKSTFNFSTNTDALARTQLIQTAANSPNIAYTGFPVSSAELQTVDQRQTLGKTALAYAPVAISGVVIAFLAEFDGGRQEQMNVSPRLLAKILTQSYVFTVPRNSSDPTRNVAHLGAVNRTYAYLNQDPEFRALNPDNYNQFTSNPAIVVPGPAGADAIRQVWRWIFADQAATAFVEGTPDPWGMTVNPYYLPQGNAAAVVPWYLDDQKNFIADPVQRAVGLVNIDGTPKHLATANLDTFPKNDQSVVPLRIVPVAEGGAGEKSRFDSFQFEPYAADLLAAALQAFRANPNSKTVWDGTKLNSAGEAGDWVSSGTQLPGAKFMLVVTDSPSAARYGLNTAGVQVPNTATLANPLGTIINANATAMGNALSALQSTSLDNVKQINPAAVATNGYPMTMVTYAGVNLSKATLAARTTIAAMIKQITTTGQATGTAVGELPAGYLPLTADLQAQASTAATAIQAYVAPASPVTTTTNGIAQDSSDFAANQSGLSAQNAAVDPSLTAGTDLGGSGVTEASSVLGLPSSGLVIALGIGVAGVLIAPILFRGRGFF